jgi:hypothetical protein
MALSAAGRLLRRLSGFALMNARQECMTLNTGVSAMGMKQYGREITGIYRACTFFMIGR